ncbi:MAG: fructose-bisphosphatase class II, partial [Candidatus Promineifilaceae bacterium]
MENIAYRNIGLDLIRVTEAAAIVAGRWIGLGMHDATHHAATKAAVRALNSIEIQGHIVMGEEGRLGEYSPLSSGAAVGIGTGPELDVIIDPIDGTNLVIKGHSGAMSVIGIAPKGSVWSPDPSAVYMEKIIVDGDVADALVPECLDAPAAWTLALIARVKKKQVRDLAVIVLDRPRHSDLIEEIRLSGARILLRSEGDVEGALEAALHDRGADALMGIGGVAEGLIAACAVKALGGAMIARLAPQSESERLAVEAAGLDRKRVLNCDELVTSNQVYFAATGITNSV